MKELIQKYSGKFDPVKDTAIILAAGHGKRIKSNTSKMLHEIWGEPTVKRVSNACRKGLPVSNQVIVVGIKAEEVIKTLGRTDDVIFANQAEQNGTGHAVQMALEQINCPDYNKVIYVLPGDMGLVNEETMRKFNDDFYKSGCDMMVLTGLFDGPVEENAYGRIIRVKEEDVKGIPSEELEGNVIEIKEHKDILALKDNEFYYLEYKERAFAYTKKELLETNEFNSGVFAFRAEPLFELITKIKNENSQGEIYLTDLIDLFNKADYKVGAVSPDEQYVLTGFNNKSVLVEMNDFARSLIYNKIKNLVLIEDKNDFYISENIVDQILKMDEEGFLPDLKLAKGASLKGEIKLGTAVSLGRNAQVSGNVILEDGVKIDDGAKISGNSKIGEGSEIKGDSKLYNIEAGKNCKIYDSVISDKKIAENSFVKFYMEELVVEGNISE